MNKSVVVHIIFTPLQSLIFVDVNRDAGVYSLVAYNRTGELWHHFTIRVKGQP
jgi:hypothetical protein